MGNKRYSGLSTSHTSRPVDVDPLDKPLDSVEAKIIDAAAKGARPTHGFVKADKASHPGLDKPAEIEGHWWKRFFSTRPMHLRPLVVNPEVFDKINWLVEYMGRLRAESTDFLSFHFKRHIETYGKLPLVNATTVRHAMYFIRDRGQCKIGETDGMRASYNKYVGAYSETGYSGQPPSDDAFTSIISYMADDCIKNIHNNVSHNLPLTVSRVIELELTTDIRAEGKLFPQPESDQRTAKRKKQWPKSKHRKIRAVAVADTTMPNVCATPVGDVTSAAGDALSDVDSDAWSEIGAYVDCDIWSDVDSDAWSDGDSYVDCDAYVDCNAWPTVSTYVDYDTWSDVDSNAHDETGDEQVDSTSSVADVDCGYTHKCDDDYDLTRMAHIRRRRNRQENREKLEKRLGIHHSQHVPPVKDLAVDVQSQSQRTPLILHAGCKARHKRPGRNVAPISVDPVVEERGLADEQARKKQDQDQDQDQEKAVACSRQLALWRDYQRRLKDARSDARSRAKAMYDRLCSMIKSKKFDWDAKNSSADWVRYGAPAAEALKLPDDEHLKQIQDSYADAIVSDSSKPGRQRKSTRAAVEPADTESAMISTDPAQADVVATQPATIASTQSPMELVGDVSAMDVDGPLSAPVAHGSAMDVDGASAKTEYIGLSKEPPPTKKMSGYEKKGRMLSKALMFMYNQNVKLDSLGGKQVALIPLFAAEASHITIDSWGLDAIICSVAKAHEHFDRPETNRDDFYHNRLFYWPHYFCLPQEYLRRHGVDVVGDKKYFNLMLTTDGVGVSIGLTWWRSFRKGKAKQDDDNEQLPSDEDDIAPSPYDNDDNEDEDNYSSTDTVLVKGVRVGRVFDKPAPTDYDREFVGADPGAGKIASLSKLSDPTWHRSYSASTYYADIGNATRVAESESDIDSVKGLCDWMSEMPDSRTSTAEKALQRLKDLYGSRFYCELLNIRMSLATRKRRWYFFRRKRRAIVQACQYWTYGLDKKKTTICIGDAKFSTSRHGFRATPSIRMFGRYLQEAGWHVIYIWEFNTSRVCSNCHLDLAHDEFPNAMCGLGEEADKFAYRHKAKSTFKVRRCTNPACGRPWDRDRNAAWNIAYLGMLRYFQRERPLYFSKSLDNLPKYASDNRAARNAAAQEVGAQKVAAAKEAVTGALRARAMAIERGELTVSKAHTRRNTRDDRAKASRAESARTFEYTSESVRKMVMEDRLESGCANAIEAATKFAKAKKAEEKEMATKAKTTKTRTKAKTSTATARKIAQPTAPSSVLARRANTS